MSKRLSRSDLKVGRTTKNALGYAIWWTLHSGEISVPDMEKVLNATLGMGYMPGQPRKKRALRLALKNIEEAGLIVKIRDDEVMLAYGLAGEETDKNAVDFSIKKKNIIILDKASGKIRFNLTFKNKEIEDLFDKYQQVYTEQDYRPVALNYLYVNNGITLRDTGGVYFMPEEQHVLMLKTFFERLGCEFNFLPIIPDKESKKQVKEIATAEFKKALEEAAADVTLYTTKDTTRDSTLATRLAYFQTIQKRAEAYADLIEMESEELKNKLNDLRKRIEKALMGDSKKLAHSKQYPPKSRWIFTDDGDDYNNQECTIVGYDMDGKNPTVKVLFDDGEVCQIYADSEFLKKVS